MTFLTPHLPFPSSSSTSGALPPGGSHLVITDTLISSAQFAVYHLLALAIQQKQRIIWVDFRIEGRSSVEAVLRKMVSRLKLVGRETLNSY
jgi:hypothetical protein